MDNKWIRVKDRLPPFNLFVEVYHKDVIKNHKKRSYCALLKRENGIFWSDDGWDEEMSGKFGITHWRYMEPDPYGRVPFMTVSKRGAYKVVLRRMTDLVDHG